MDKPKKDKPRHMRGNDGNRKSFLGLLYQEILEFHFNEEVP